MKAVRLYESWKQETAQLTLEEKGRLVEELIEYAITGKEERPEGNERFIYPLLVARIRREAETHERRIAEAKNEKKTV